MKRISDAKQISIRRLVSWSLGPLQVLFFVGRRWVHAEWKHLRRGRFGRGFRRLPLAAQLARRPHLPPQQPLRAAAALLHQRSAGKFKAVHFNFTVWRHFIVFLQTSVLLLTFGPRFLRPLPGAGWARAKSGKVTKCRGNYISPVFTHSTVKVDQELKLLL